MAIYDLNNPAFLEHDIDAVLEKVYTLYKVDFKQDYTAFLSKTIVPKTSHWSKSPECVEAFNKLIPKVKSLTYEMYAILETVYKYKTGSFKKDALEAKHQHLKELRLLNNKFKHFFGSEAEITFTSMVIDEWFGYLVDIWVNYKSKNGFNAVRFADLISTFLSVLEELSIITIERSLTALRIAGLEMPRLCKE